MKWVLFVLLFTTGAYNDPHAQCGQKKYKCYAEMSRDQKLAYIDHKDKSHTWKLQSTTTTEYVDEKSCDAAGARIYAAVAPVSTLTFRGYCLCSSLKAGDNECPADATSAAAAIKEEKALPEKRGLYENRLLQEKAAKDLAASEPKQPVSMHQIAIPFFPK